MANKSDLQDWIREALKIAGGSAALVDVAKRIWDIHEKELRRSGDMFYTWQYDMRWAALALRKRNILKEAKESTNGQWELLQTDGVLESGS